MVILKVSRFNLLDEKWIFVINDKLEEEQVSLRELIAIASKIKCLAGEMKCQDFAILRLVLAIFHTVFSRFDYYGNPHMGVELDNKLKQLHPIDEDDMDDYKESLYNTWGLLWKNKDTPQILNKYLNIWMDRFYLYDDEFPFFQVTKSELSPCKIYSSSGEGSPTSVNFKTINRRISESENKLALFSPVSDDNKNILTDDELARWLIMYQAYSSVSEKAILGKEKYSSFRGLPFLIGGTYLSGNNLLETILLNLVLVHPFEQYIGSVEMPCWELKPSEVIENNLLSKPINNLAELYTLWSKAVFLNNINNEKNDEGDYVLQVAKLKAPDLENFFIEPMTNFKLKSKKDLIYTPYIYRQEEALWRNFNIFLSDSDDFKQFLLLKWLKDINVKFNIPNKVSINSVTMLAGGSSSSQIPVREIADKLTFRNILLDNIEFKDKFLLALQATKDSVNKAYWKFLMDIAPEKSSEWRNKEISKVYYRIDGSFRDFTANINASSDIDVLIVNWYNDLYKILKEAGNTMVNSFIKSGQVNNAGADKNIFEAFNDFDRKLFFKLKVNKNNKKLN